MLRGVKAIRNDTIIIIPKPVTLGRVNVADLLSPPQPPELIHNGPGGVSDAQPSAPIAHPAPPISNASGRISLFQLLDSQNTLTSEEWQENLRKRPWSGPSSQPSPKRRRVEATHPALPQVTEKGHRISEIGDPIYSSDSESGS